MTTEETGAGNGLGVFGMSHCSRYGYRSRDDLSLGVKLAFYGVVLALMFLLPAFGACTETEGARRAVEDAGLSNVQTGSYAWFNCGGDRFATRFTATRDGRSVSGAVCAGWFKGHTVRFD